MNEFKNPSQEPGTEKRLFTVFGVTLLAIILSQFALQKFNPPPPPQKPGSTESKPVGENPKSGASAPSVTAPAATAPAKSAAPAKPVEPGIKQAASEQDVVVENDLYKVIFTNKGAQVRSWILKTHKTEKGEPLDLVHHQAAKMYGYPLSFFTYDAELRGKLNSALYTSNATAAMAPATLTFEYSDGEVSARKVFRFDHSYVIHVETEVLKGGSRVSAYPTWPAGFGDMVSKSSFAASFVEYHTGSEVIRRAPFSGFIFKDWLGNGTTINGPFHWGGVADQYFAAIFMPDQPSNTALVALHNSLPYDEKEQDPEKRKKNSVSILGVAVGNPSGFTSERLFVGPKDLGVLKNVRAHDMTVADAASPNGPNLESTVDFGFFGMIAKPLFLWLKWTYKHVPNWGWAIVILTIIINLALFPLRYSGMKSALMMQKIQPEVKQINERYRDLKITDPRQREKQLEMQALMKREGINQLGGCIPSLMQIPFLFAFYTMLSTANELRLAPWLWIRDLSSPDPLYILPLAIMVSMFFMQKITPMAGMDPAQVQMMKIMMPIMIGLFSFTLPAGLGVYWVTGNIIGYFTQLFMNNTRHAKEIRAHLAERETRKRDKLRKSKKPNPDIIR